MSDGVSVRSVHSNENVVIRCRIAARHSCEKEKIEKRDRQGRENSVEFVAVMKK